MPLPIFLLMDLQVHNFYQSAVKAMDDSNGYILVLKGQTFVANPVILLRGKL